MKRSFWVTKCSSGKRCSRNWTCSSIVSVGGSWRIQLTRTSRSRKGSRASEKSEAMKAIRAHQFGPSHVLQLDEGPAPKPGTGEVLVQIKASGVDPAAP